MVGKTNMDQFAAGLVGTRTPYGVARCAFDDRFVPGGSSSGSGVVVGGGLVSFALGTDTAGSGEQLPLWYTLSAASSCQNRCLTLGLETGITPRGAITHHFVLGTDSAGSGESERHLLTLGNVRL